MRATHGEAGPPATRRYRAWVNMRDRCYNPLFIGNKYYGGRGITVDPAWRSSYEQFALDMGPHPGKGWTLERVKNNLGYSKSNCVWATAATQQHNTRQTKLTTRAVAEIRRLYVRGSRWCPGNVELLAARFGVHRQHITTVARGAQWK